MSWGQAFSIAVIIVGAVWWLLEKYVGGMKASVNALKSALTEKDATIESKEAHIQFLESQISPTVQEHREAAIRVLEEKVGELTEELDTKETELEAAQEKAQRADAVDSYTQAFIANLETNLASIRGERASLIDAQKALLRSMFTKPEVAYPQSIIQQTYEQAKDIEGPWPGYFYALPTEISKRGPPAEEWSVLGPAFPSGREPRGPMLNIHHSSSPLRDTALVWVREPIVGLEPLNEIQLRHQCELREVPFDEVVARVQKYAEKRGDESDA